MKKWSDIKQATLNKLFMDSDEATQLGYVDMFAMLADECLNFIANSVKPQIKTFDFLVKENSIIGTDFEVVTVESNTFIKYNGSEYVVGDKSVLYIDFNSGFRYCYDPLTQSLQKVENVYCVGEMIRMPDDFIAFSDMSYFINNEEKSDLPYINANYIKCEETGVYKIFYDALWETIKRDDLNETTIINIDVSVLNLLPTYIASQVLAQDDVQRSVILKNEFEVMLSRLNNENMYAVKHYESKGGWY